MADEKTSEAQDAPKKGGKLKLAIGALALMGAGAGGAYGAFASGLIGEHAEKDGPDVPKLVLKGEEDPFASHDEKKGEGEGEEIHGEGGSKYRTAYFRFADSFTSNLKDSAGLIQVELACSTKRDGRVLQWLKRHELAIRSAILVELADTPEADVLSPEGKRKLQQRLVKAINKVLEETEGFGGIDNVYFEAFLVQ